MLEGIKNLTKGVEVINQIRNINKIGAYLDSVATEKIITLLDDVDQSVDIIAWLSFLLSGYISQIINDVDSDILTTLINKDVEGLKRSFLRCLSGAISTEEDIKIFIEIVNREKRLPTEEEEKRYTKEN